MPAGGEVVQGFRLILSDPLMGGGQRVKTFNMRPVNLTQLVGFLAECVDLREICGSRGIDSRDLVAVQLSLHATGIDGPRRVPIRTDEQLAAFLMGLRSTRLATLEVQLANAAVGADKPELKSVPPVALVETHRPGGRDPRDRVEQMEDDNFRLLRATDRVERRLDELERLFNINTVETQRTVETLRHDTTQEQVSATANLQAQHDALVKAHAGTVSDLEAVRQHLLALEKEARKNHQDLTQSLAALADRTEGQFDDVGRDLEALRTEDERQDAEAQRVKAEHETVMAAHAEELHRLDSVKVEVELWRRTEAEMTQRLDEEHAAVTKRIAQVEAKAWADAEQVRKDSEVRDEQISNLLQENVTRIDEAARQLQAAMEAGLQAAEKHLADVRQEVLKDTESKVSALSQSTDTRFTDTKNLIAAKDLAANKRIDALTGSTETTFQVVSERIQEMARVERERLCALEKDLVDITTRIRSDCRAEIERVRVDYEQEAARVDADVSDLHMKHDVTKQEINFFQSRLLEQREWTQRQLTETATATRAVALDAQEGITATTKMLHALRDDAVAFREKMAKYVSMLQHSSDSYGDAINTLELQRSRLRAELDALLADHKAYTADMDGWADDVRLKVERLFRAMEPPRLEWRITRAVQRAKELKKPLAVLSPAFSLRGLRDVKMEFYPDGHNSSPDGKAVLRLFLSPGSHIRFQCWVGKVTDGPHVHSADKGLSVDILLDSWRDQIQEDGSVPVTLEVLRDFNNNDEALSREVRLESI